MKNYRSFKSAYRDGYRISHIREGPSKDMFTFQIKKGDDEKTMADTRNNLEGFFGKVNFSLILEENK